MVNGRDERSRGDILFPGDMIQFIASMRIFCLVGSSEKDRKVYISANLNKAKHIEVNQKFHMCCH